MFFATNYWTIVSLGLFKNDVREKSCVCYSTRIIEYDDGVLSLIVDFGNE